MPMVMQVMALEINHGHVYNCGRGTVAVAAIGMPATGKLVINAAASELVSGGAIYIYLWLRIGRWMNYGWTLKPYKTAANESSDGAGVGVLDDAVSLVLDAARAIKVANSGGNNNDEELQPAVEGKATGTLSYFTFKYVRALHEGYLYTYRMGVLYGD